MRYLLPLLLCACASPDYACPVVDVEDAYAEAEERWEDLVGMLPSDCYETPVDTYIGPRAGFRGCRDVEVAEGSWLAGCSRWNPLEWRYEVDLVECQRDMRQTAIHERAHTLHHCVYGDPDGDHSNTNVWGPVAVPRVEDKQ